MKKSALFFDIDGTLIENFSGGVPESAVRALRMAVDAGHQTFINTGRTACNIEDFLLELPITGFLLGCGTEIVYQGKRIMYSPLTQEQCIRYSRAVKECKVDGMMEGSQKLFVSRDVSRFPHMEKVRQLWLKEYPEYIGFMEDEDSIYDKIFVFTDEKSDVERFAELIGDGLTLLDRRHGAYECVQTKYSKATAIEYIRNMLGYDMDQIYVFGDSSNDLAMFEYAEHAIAMKDHDPVLDPYTEYVTDSVADDGIYKAMKHYGLI